MSPVAWIGQRVKLLVAPLMWYLVRQRALDLRSTSKRLRAIGGAGSEVSGIFPPSPIVTSDIRLLKLAAAVIPLADGIELKLLRERGAPAYVHIWPGEHYRLLAALVHLLEPHLVIEIGTYRGHGVLAMLPELSPGGKIATIDIVPWEATTDCLLRIADFQSGNLVQLIADAGRLDDLRPHQDLFRAADLIFIDAAKDGILEREILENLETIGLRPGALVLFDDIRVWNMLEIWRDIARPKLDLTSLGHYSGTGLVAWSPPIGGRESP